MQKALITGACARIGCDRARGNPMPRQRQGRGDSQENTHAH